MPNFELGAMPDQISAEVIALLEQAGTATMGHWRYWGLCDRRIQPVLRGRRVAGTAVTVAIPGADSTLLHHALVCCGPVTCLWWIAWAMTGMPVGAAT